MLSLAEALAVSSRLVALSVGLQTLELLAIRRIFDDDGPFPPRAGANAANRLVQSRAQIVAMLALQLVVCLHVLFSGASALLLVVFATYALLFARFGGPFNGGSDALSALALLMLGVAGLGSADGFLMKLALGYLGVQVVLSYATAGVAKLKQASWRTGRALRHFAALTKYGVPVTVRSLLLQPSVAFVASWAILLFECTFPLALRGPLWCVSYLSVGALFHLMNAYCFGLNRFFFSWLAVYPVLFAWSTIWR